MSKIVKSEIIKAKKKGEKDIMVLHVEMQKPEPSVSGKTKHVVTPTGFETTSIEVEGKLVDVNVMATIKNK